MGLHLASIYMQDKSDWSLIVDDLDPFLLETLGLCQNSLNQVMSVPDVVDLYLSRFQTQAQRGTCGTIALGSFTLDIVPPSLDERLRLQNILRLPNMNVLNVTGTSFNSSLSETFVQVLCSVPWPFLTSLVLSGKVINAWIGLLADVLAPQLQRLAVQGTKSNKWRLSHTGALIVQRLIQRCPLMGLKFQNVQLQEMSDWTAIVESADPLVLKSIEMCETTRGQFVTAQEAVDLYNVKLMKNSLTMSVSGSI